MDNKQNQLLKNADKISTQAMEDAIKKSYLPVISLITLFILLELIPNFYIDGSSFFVMRLIALLSILSLIYPSIVYVKKRMMKNALNFITN